MRPGFSATFILAAITALFPAGAVVGHAVTDTATRTG